MASAADPALWSDANGDTPPQQWQAVASDQRWWWSWTPAPNPIMYIGDRPLPEVLEFDWEIVENPEAQMFFGYFLEGVGGETIPLGNTVGSGTIEIPTAGYVPGGEFYFSLSSFYGPDAYAGTAAILGPDIPAPPVPPPPVPTCVEWGRETRAYVSGYDRTKVHQSRLYRFERRCLVANFNGAIPPGRRILSATWRTDAPEIGVISDPKISTNGRETMVMFASQLGGWANLRCEVTLDNGEIYNQVFRVNVREASFFFNDPPTHPGPFSVTVNANV